MFWIYGVVKKDEGFKHVELLMWWMVFQISWKKRIEESLYQSHKILV